jgi:SAM-dependent methyltransferase
VAARAGRRRVRIDLRADYLANGREYLEGIGHDGGRLRLVEDGRYPFDDATFDLVISDQVLEHVADLDGFVREVTRVSRPHSTGLHVFPARWRPVEVHMRTPLVHWLPKGRARRVGLRAALAVGAAAPYFRELDGVDRCEVFAHYSETETFYRPLAEIRSVFARAGLDTAAAATARERVLARAALAAASGGAGRRRGAPHHVLGLPAHVRPTPDARLTGGSRPVDGERLPASGPGCKHRRVRLPVVVVGAGAAGLSVSKALVAAGVEHEVLERAEVADTWRQQRWDSFRLNTRGG